MKSEQKISVSFDITPMYSSENMSSAEIEESLKLLTKTFCGEVENFEMKVEETN
jgi:hypothetical protein